MSAALKIVEHDWQAAWLACRNNPLLFVTGVLGLPLEQIEPWQREALSKVCIPPRRLSVRSGHGSGKSAFLSWVTLWFLLTRGSDTKIPIIATSQDQLRGVVWPELRKWWNKLPQPLRDQIEITSDRVVIKDAPDEAFAWARTARPEHPETLQGFHAQNVLVLMEEASGIAEQVIEVLMGAMSTEGAIAIAVGNPTRTSGFFHATHCSPAVRARWHTMHVNCEHIKRAAHHVEDIIALYGKDSNKYRVRVLGEFPNADDDTVIPLADVVAAKGRDIRASHVYPKWGVDVARHGDDSSALVKRGGNTLLDVPKVWRNLDGPQLAGRIIHEFEKTPKDLRPKRISIDSIGVGYSVYDHLRLPGSPVAHIAIGVNVAESNTASALDRRLRDELWFKGRQWFAGRDCSIPKALFAKTEDNKIIEQLVGELTAVTYDYDVGGKRVVEPKRQMKERLGHSPDLADAFLLTFEGGEFPREPDEKYRRWYTDPDEYTEPSDAWDA